MIVNNVRSAINVGSLLRTADGLGIKNVYLCGITPYPRYPGDNRIPHESQSVTARIVKTSLGAEKTVNWQYHKDTLSLIGNLKSKGCRILALEQTVNSINLSDYKPPKKAVLIVGNEVNGLEPEILAVSDDVVQIPMKGAKESLNVSAAAAIAMYALTT